MTRNHWTLIAVAALLAGLSLYLNRDWFAKDNIQIFHRSRPLRAGFFSRKRPDTSTVNPVVFGFDRKLKLTDIKVVPLSAISTNKYAHPLWHLVSDSNSVPTKDFLYGLPIRGMRPDVKGTTADPLEAGVQYRLLVEAESFKGEHDFEPTPRTR